MPYSVAMIGVKMNEHAKWRNSSTLHDEVDKIYVVMYQHVYVYIYIYVLLYDYISTMYICVYLHNYVLYTICWYGNICSWQLLTHTSTHTHTKMERHPGWIGMPHSQPPDGIYQLKFHSLTQGRINKQISWEPKWGPPQCHPPPKKSGLIKGLLTIGFP